MRALALAALVLAAIAPNASAASFFRLDGATAGEQAGVSVSGAGDVNGDGRRDLIVGAPFAGAGGTAYVVYGPFTSGTLDLAALGSRGFVITGAKTGAMLGQSVAAAGDVSSDGLADVIVGVPGTAPSAEGPRPGVGHAYVVFGSHRALRTDAGRLGTHGMVLRGRKWHFPDAFGWSVSGAGDVNRDGYDDVVAGDHGYRGTGAGYLAYGGRRGTVLISGTPRGADLGYSVAGGGDFDGDGLDDMVLSEPQAHRNHVNQAAGGAWLVRGAHRRGAIDVRRRGVELRGSAGDWAGFAVALGRVDDDRLSDVVTTERGSLAVVAGNRHPGPVALPSGAAWLLDGTIEENPGFSTPDAGGFTTSKYSRRA